MGKVGLYYYHNTLLEGPFRHIITSVEVLGSGGIIKHKMYEALLWYYESASYLIKLLKL